MNYKVLKIITIHFLGAFSSLKLNMHTKYFGLKSSIFWKKMRFVSQNLGQIDYFFYFY